MRANWITNVLLKALALLVAVLLWNFYRAEQPAIRFVVAPVQFHNLPPDRELSGDVPTSITVQVEAPEAVARGLTPEWVDASIDLSGVGLGEQQVRVDPEQVRVPVGAKVLSVTPDSIELTVESKIQKVLPVEARLRGQVASGYEVVRVTLLPRQVTVEGPESEVERTEKAVTEWIQLRGRTGTFQEGVSVVPDNPRVRLVGARSAIGTVEIRRIAPEPEEEENPGERSALQKGAS